MNDKVPRQLCSDQTEWLKVNKLISKVTNSMFMVAHSPAKALLGYLLFIQDQVNRLHTVPCTKMVKFRCIGGPYEESGISTQEK